MNNIIDQAFSQDDIIHDQTLLTGTVDPANDEVLVWHSVSAPAGLRRAKINKLPSGVTSVSMTVAPSDVFALTGTPITTTGTLAFSLKSQTANKVLCGPPSGATTTPTFRTLVPADIALTTSLIAASAIDWNLGNVFDKTLTATSNTFTFSNVNDGQTIKVRVRQNATGTATLAWNAAPLLIIWCDDVTPTVTTTPDGYSVFIFTAVTGSGGVTRIHGFLEQLPSHGLLEGDQVKNRFLAGPASGAAAPPTFRELVPPDLPAATVVLAGNAIDWSLGNCFSKSISATVSMTFSNPTEGQTIVVLVSNTGAFNLTFPTGTNGVYWAGATEYVAASGAGKHDTLIFRYIGGHYYGNYFLDFQSV